MLRVMVASATAWIVIALAAAAALLIMASAARSRGRRMERRMVSELGRRWDQPPPNTAVPSPAESVVPGDEAVTDASSVRPETDLQITLEDLLNQRDDLLEEFQAVQAQITVLKKRVERRRPVAAVADIEDETVIQLYDVLPEEWAEHRRH